MVFCAPLFAVLLTHDSRIDPCVTKQISLQNNTIKKEGCDERDIDPAWRAGGHVGGPVE